MQIKIIESFGHMTDGNFAKGRVYEVADDFATEVIHAKLAIGVAKPKPAKEPAAEQPKAEAK